MPALEEIPIRDAGWLRCGCPPSCLAEIAATIIAAGGHDGIMLHAAIGEDYRLESYWREEDWPP